MLLKKNIKLRIFLLSIQKKKIKLFFVLYDNKKNNLFKKNMKCFTINENYYLQNIVIKILELILI